MDISKEEFIKKYCKIIDEDIKYPIYKHEKFDGETNMYIGLEILKTVDELEKEQLELENQILDKTNHCKSAEELTVENQQLWETVEYLLKQVNMIPKGDVSNE